MNAYYKDILDRIDGPPKWFDENAVPRFCDFSPEETANIYAKVAALVEIACQSCEHKFSVCMSQGAMEQFKAKRTLAEMIRDGSLHYGDPPHVRCCAAGPSMNCEDLRVVEYWYQSEKYEWLRDASLEILLPDGIERQAE